MSRKVHIVFETLNFLRSAESDQLNANEKLLLIFLAAHQGRCGIFPSTQVLAKEMKVTVRYITILLSSLVEKKIIEREQSSGVVSNYRLLYAHTPEHQFGTQEDDTPEQVFTPPPNCSSVYLRTVVRGYFYIYITKLITELITQSKKPVIQEEIIELPVWLSSSDWQSFIEHRREIKSPMSLRAQRLIIKQLQKFKDDGQNVEDVLNQSIMNGWKGVFPIRQVNGQVKKESYHDKLTEALNRRIQRKANGGSIYEVPGYMADQMDSKH